MPYIFGPSSLFWSLPLHKSPQKLYPFPHTEIKGSVEYDKNTRLNVCDIVKVTINFQDLVQYHRETSLFQIDSFPFGI